MIKTIFIDLGETLIDMHSYDCIEEELEIPFWRRHGYIGNIVDFKEAKKKTVKEFIEKGHRKKDENFIWGMILAKNLGLKPDREVAKEDHKLASNYYTEKAMLRDGAIEMLKFLKKRGLKIIMISNNWSDMANRIIDKVKIRQYFNDIIISDDLMSIKSELKPFSKALEISGSKPNECLMVGDCEEDAFCKKLGIKFVWLDTGKISIKMSYDYRIETLDNLKKIIGDSDGN